MLNWGKDMISGLANGIKSMANKVKDAVSGIANKIKSFLHFSRPDEGPLREYESWMPDMISGLTSSLKKASPDLIEETKQIASSLNDAIHSGVSTDLKFDTSMYNAYSNESNRPTNNITDTSSYDPGQVAPIYLNIENFNNNREQDIEDLSEELEFYRMKINYGKGNA